MKFRERFAVGLHPVYLEKYLKLCDMLTDEWQPYVGFRSFEEQEKLYSQGRANPGRIVTWARAGESPHNWGCATDWTVYENRKFNWDNVSDDQWAYFGSACDAVGLEWGGGWSSDKIDRPHVELKGIDWKKVLAEYNRRGLKAAWGTISNV